MKQRISKQVTVYEDAYFCDICAEQIKDRPIIVWKKGWQSGLLLSLHSECALKAVKFYKKGNPNNP